MDNVGQIAVELSRSGALGVILALIVLLGLLCWGFYKLTATNIERTNEAFNRNTEALTRNTETLVSLKEFIQLLIKK